jgi:hypothetical protein
LHHLHHLRRYDEQRNELEGQMSRGFAIGVNVATADELTADNIAAEVAAAGTLTAVESQTFVPAALAAAQTLIAAIGAGPYWVWMDGTDNLATPGETTSLVVRVNSTATVAPVAVSAPEVVAEPSPVVDFTPNGEPASPPIPPEVVA